ncbi:MAG: GGDEF domain-containing protein [Acidimicrobiia bacterium]|nr:GGDEF domain-containing protein [Acidimicrobiia bacterium]
MAAFLAFVGWQLVGGSNDEQRTRIGDLFPLGLEVLTVVLAVACSMRARERRTRIAWGFVAAAYGLYLLGDGLWAYLELVRRQTPFPSVADAPYLAFYPLLLAGLLTLPAPRRRRSEWWRLGLDVLTVTIAGSMALWYLVISPTLADVDRLTAATVLSIAYPASDLVLLFGIATVLVRGLDIRRSMSLVFMAVGATAFVVADVGFARLSLSGSYQAGDWPDSGFVLALVCSIVAADWELHRPAVERRARANASRVSVSPLPYFAIAGSFALLLHVAFFHTASTVRTMLVLVLMLTATVVARQITALRDNQRMTRELHRLATTDALTSLANRRHFLEEADRCFEDRLDAAEVAAIFVDVDHFKTINDAHGHAVGDAVLAWIANELRRIVRASDLVGRYGGDEFVIVTEGLSPRGALAMADRLQRTIASVETPVPGGPDQITLSLGVAPAAGCPGLDDLLARADAALYEAKRAGRAQARLIDA